MGPREPPAGSWVCCTCRQTNIPGSAPVRCPLDGHYKCSHCYIYASARVRDNTWHDESTGDLPSNWRVAKRDERDYYVDTATHTTTWVRPSSDLASPKAELLAKLEAEFGAMLGLETKPVKITSMTKAITGATREYYDHVENRAKEANVNWPRKSKHTDTFGSRCSIFVKGKHIRIDEKEPAEAISKLVNEWKKKEECICIIENINDSWIQALDDVPAICRLELPGEFFVGQASPCEPRPAFQNASISPMDDVIERAFAFERTLDKEKKNGVWEEIIEELLEVRLTVKKSVESWGLCDVSSSELDRVAGCVAECEKALAKMSEEAKSTGSLGDKLEPQTMLTIHALRRQRRDLEHLRQRRYFNLYASCEFEEHVLRPHAKAYEGMFFERKVQLCNDDQGFASATADWGRGDVQNAKQYSMDTHVSYIRVDKTLCLILVDPRPSTSFLKPGRPGRSKVRLNFPHANAGNGIDVPDLLELQSPSIFDSLAVFATEEWHTDLLCGERRLPPTFQDYLEGTEMRPNFAALEPEGFLLMLSSCLWNRNLQFLHKKVHHISFRWLPNASNMKEMIEINERLHECREDLEILVSQVEHARMHMPAHLAAYFEDFPRIRQRHTAAHFQPVDYLPELLDRARKLEKIILDDFQILSSSVSVCEGHESMEKSELAAWATVLAAFYLPLTLVTGIFGMNIKGADGFGSKPAIGAFVGAFALTILLALVAWQLRQKHIHWSDVWQSVKSGLQQRLNWKSWRKAKGNEGTPNLQSTDSHMA